MANRSGWAWGTTDSGEWLTILGSHWAPGVLVPTAEEAIRPVVADAEWNAGRFFLAYVSEVYHPGVSSGRAYRIDKTREVYPDTINPKVPDDRA